MRTIGSLFILLVVVGGLVAVVYGIAGSREIIHQPIVFNHVVHLEEASLTCIECHTDAATDRFAGLPRKNVCLDCHDIDEEQGAHPEKDKLFAYDETDQKIPWRRVAITRPDVFFSHRRHVGTAQIDCLTCHVDQATLTAPPPTARLVMRMTSCLACHKQKGVSTDCLACHR